MPFANPIQNQTKYWYNGQPLGAAVKNNARANDQQTYWYNGQPIPFVVPPRPPVNKVNIIS